MMHKRWFESKELFRMHGRCFGAHELFWSTGVVYDAQ